MQQPIIEQVSKSNFARRAILQLGQKLVTLPSYGVELGKQIDFKTMLENNLGNFEHINFVSGPLSKLGDIISEKETRRDLKNSTGEFVEKKYLDLREKIWFMDSFCDALYYASFEAGLKDFSRFSKEVRDFLSTITQSNYASKFRDLKDDTSLYMKFIREVVQEQVNYRMDFVTPPVPLIFNDSPNYLVDIWFDMIKTTAILADTKADKPSSVYLTVHSNNFKKPEVLNLVLGKLFDEATEQDISHIKFVVLKVIDEGALETETAGMRLRYRQFITDLSMYCSNTNRTLIMLDSNSLGLTSISLGVDAFIEPLNGVTGIGFRKSKDKHGRFYHPEGLKFDGYNDINELYKNTGSLPCNCKFCSVVKVKDLNDLGYPTWWSLRRSHLAAARNEEVKEFHEAIEQGIITNAITDKIQRSDVKNYLDFLPK